MSYFENTTKLPSRLFKVRVPILATYTAEEIDIFGLPINSNDGKLDKESYKDMTVVMFNIDRIIDTYIAGYPINLINPSDSKILFDILEEYIYINNHNIQYSPNQQIIKDDRLLEIDKMLSEMFDYNRGTIVNSMVSNNNGFALNMGTVNTGMGVVNMPVKLEEDEEEFGIMSGYNKQNNNANNPFIQPNQPSIDISKINRKPMVKKFGGGLNNVSLFNNDNEEKI